jgi:hypothetical protein
MECGKGDVERGWGSVFKRGVFEAHKAAIILKRSLKNSEFAQMQDAENISSRRTPMIRKKKIHSATP